MPRRFLLAAALLAAAPALADERRIPITSFDRLVLAGGANVIVRPGSPGVVARGSAEALDRLEIEVKSGTLSIGQKRRWRAGSGEKVTVEVSGPPPCSAVLAGSGSLEVASASADRFEGVVSGSGNLSVSTLRAETARFIISGSGNATAMGSSGEAEAVITGSGNIRLSGLQAQKVSASITGSGNIEARASGTARARLVGSGDILIRGVSSCEQSKTGSGRIRCEA